MKLTKGMIRNLIKEEIEASLEEEVKVPTQIQRAMQAVFGDSGDGKFLDQIKANADKLNATVKAKVGLELMKLFGLDADPSKLRSAIAAGEGEEEQQGEESAE